jgi:hypothetical protein
VDHADVTESKLLHLHFGLQQVASQRDGGVKFAPTKAEEEQAPRLGVDIHEIRETIRDCYQHHKDGQTLVREECSFTQSL